MTTLPADMGLALWLVPSPDEHAQLQHILDRLAKDAKGPTFQAHVTLLTVPNSTPLPLPPLNLDKLNPLTLKFLRVEAGQTYFQSVLIAVDPSPELQSLHDSARNTLNKPLPSGSSYFPHLSLFYGGDNQEFKESLVRRLYEDGTAVPLDGTQGVAVAGVSEIHMQEVWLLRSEGPPEEWEILEKWRLGSDADQPTN